MSAPHRRINLKERQKNAVHILGTDADARICHFDGHMRIIGQIQRQPDAPRLGKAQGVVQQIAHDLPQTPGIAQTLRTGAPFDLQPQIKPARAGFGPMVLHHDR